MFLRTHFRLRFASATVAVAGLAVALLSPLSVEPAAAAGYVNPTNPDVVAVAGGSYAAAPPESLDTPGHNVSNTVSKQLYIDASQSGKPVPTNAWWTDLAVSKYSGDLWADPLVNKNTVDGTSIYYPTRWSAEGNQRVLESPITVGGEIVPTPPAGDVTLADFEGTTNPDGWTATGSAFNAPSAGTAKGQGGVSGFLGNGLANSFTDELGDGASGTLTSPAFTIDHDFVAFMIAGGNHPDDEVLQLVIDGQVVESATGANSEQLAWVTWDVSGYAGKTATLQLVDKLTAGWAHIMADQVTLTDNIDGLATRFDTAFVPESANALRWGDWNVSWRMQHTGGSQYVDATAARGTPYTWFEYSNMSPRITLQPGATITDSTGEALAFPARTDRFQVTQDGRTFGIHAAEGSSFTRHGDVIAAELAADYLVVSAVPESGASLDFMHEHAFAVPRNTTMTYDYSAEKGAVTENWAIDTHLLQGTSHDTIQGWLPHQWRETTNNLDYEDFTYESPRGQVKTTVGHGGWTMDYRFTGLTPFAPAPEELGKSSDYDLDRMNAHLDSYATITGYGGDTYWGGKDLQQFASYMQMAKQVGNEDAYAKLRASLTTALTDWYTYTPGEKERFFARYDTWEALVGFSDSYGSFEFTDHHFHYGYFTLATALLAFEDPEWARQFGPMATLVAKEYANWDRADESYPYLRTFDTWEGHSYAGGYSSPGGNNQESSSEAIQSWAGLYLLGTALGNAEMQATGAMGYVTERAAVQEYYLDQNGNPDATHNPNAVGATGPGVFPDSYKHTTTGILFDSGQAYATYFSGDPAWIYGIQWMPTAPWLNYLGWDPAFSRSLLHDMFAARPGLFGGDVGNDNGNKFALAAKRWHGVGTDWGNPVAENRVEAIAAITAAITNAYVHNPGMVLAKDAANPLFDPATGDLVVSVNADGTLAYPAASWTPQTLPAALVPIAPPADNPDADVKTWGSAYPAYAYFAKNYTFDEATVTGLYSYDVTGFTPGNDADLAQAVAVYKRMGDAVGNVVLGMVAQSDPEFYAAVTEVLWDDKDPVATSNSMAGAVYYNAMSNRGLGIETLDRHTNNPTSQVYFNAETNEYSYVLYNPTDAQKSYNVYDGDTVIGRIAVPARTQVNHHLDAALDRIDIAASTPVTTVPKGGEVRFTATGIDQYGAEIDLDDVSWESTDGGTITEDGTFTGTANTSVVTVTVTSSGVSATTKLRVGPTPVLTSVAVTPGFGRVVTGETRQFTASGRDQYGDPIDAGAPGWSFSGNGSVDASGLLTAGAVGTGSVTASFGAVTGSAVVAVTLPAADVAQGKPATSSSDWGGNTAAQAVDGDAGSRWESARGDDEWMQVDLGARHDLSRVQVDWENAAAAEYKLQVSDKAAGPWTTLTTVTKTQPTPDDVAVDGAGRYLRVAGVKRLTQYGYSIFGLRVYGTVNAASVIATELRVSPQQGTVVAGRHAKLTAYVFDANAHGGPIAAAWTVDGGGTITDRGVFSATTEGGPFTAIATLGTLTATATLNVAALDGVTPEPLPEPTPEPSPEPTPVPQPEPTNVALGKTVTASSSENGGLSANLAVDGTLATRWSSAFTDDEWIEVDLGSVLPISSIGLAWENAHGSRFTLQTRDSASDAWRTIVTEAAGTGGYASYPVEASGRYVRMLGEKRSSPYGYSLHEFRVFS